jgi:hypothetical protein
MSSAPIADWIQAFEDAIVRHAEFACKNSTTANRHFDRSIEAWRALSERGDVGLSAIAKLLEHERTAVRVTAATYLLPHRTVEALRVLTAARQAGDPLAVVTLERWARGFYLDPLTGREVWV